MSNPLEQKVNFWGLIRFTAPTMVMMMFMSLYIMVDGAFVSIFLGTDALSAVNMVYPCINFIIAIAIMLASGGNAVIGKKMGEGEQEEAKKSFSLIVLTGLILGIIVLILGLIFTGDLVWFLGSSEKIYTYCYEYIFSLFLFTPFIILSLMFQHLFVTAGKPNLGLILTFCGGISNIVLDYLFIVTLDMGIKGAAIATGIGFSIPAVAGIIYFSVAKKGVLHFVKPSKDYKMLGKVCGNGSSEMVSNLADAVATFLFNIVMMKLLGEDGVAAITIVLYAKFLSTAIYLGYSTGIAPLISFNYGNKNKEQLQKLFSLSLKFLGGCSLVVILLVWGLDDQIISFFAQEGSNVYRITKEGMGIFSISYLLMGFNIFASGMFTAFSNGKISATISFLRTFLFLSTGILLWPAIFGVFGVWIAVPIAELISLMVTVYFWIKMRKIYHYG